MTLDSQEYDFANRSRNAASWSDGAPVTGWRRGLSSLLLLVAVFSGWMALPSFVTRDVQRGLVPEASAAVPTRRGVVPQSLQRTRPIEEIRVGHRVVARNPEISDAERAAWPDEPDWSTWQLVRLEMPQGDDAVLHIDLLRPREWLEAQQVAMEGWIEVDLPEMGASGLALVREIGPCPPIEAGSGKVVTATFRHPPATQVLNVSFVDSLTDHRVRAATGERTDRVVDTIGVTDNHLFCSADRDEFVPIGQMQEGERVVTYHGDTKRIVSKLPRPGPHEVYNLEVYAEHVYFVGTSGLLVHNAYDSTKLDDYADTAFDAIMGSGNKVYGKGDVVGAIEAAHGFKPTGGQYKKIMDRLRSVFEEGPGGVKVSYVNGQRTVDFGSWAKTYGPADLPAGFVLKPNGLRTVDDFRASHIRQLNSLISGSANNTWHHMYDVSKFQEVNPQLHQLFKGHVGLEAWGL